MPPSFSCTEDHIVIGPELLHTTNLGDVILHLELLHEPGAIRRIVQWITRNERDPNGYIWCCYACKRKSGRKCRKYRSDQAMWDHINACHEDWLVDIVETPDWVVV
jgi:hypothetical protein